LYHSSLVLYHVFLNVCCYSQTNVLVGEGLICVCYILALIMNYSRLTRALACFGRKIGKLHGEVVSACHQQVTTNNPEFQRQPKYDINLCGINAMPMPPNMASFGSCPPNVIWNNGISDKGQSSTRQGYII